MSKPIILKAAELPEATVAELHAMFDVLELPKDKAAAKDFLVIHGAAVRGIALRKTIIDNDFLDLVPNLEIISSYSAGLDNVDVGAVKARGIRIENTSHVLAEDVANAALGLAISITRNLVEADHFVRSGTWRNESQFPLGRSMSKMTVGVVGFGTIGQAVARRLEALGAKVAYYGPHKKSVPQSYYDDVVKLATDCDMLILTCPLTPETHHLVGADVLEALGPRGFVVNVARGPVVNEAALIHALSTGQIAGAALDVFEHEPTVPQALLAAKNVVLAPHLGSGTEETRKGMADNVVISLAAHFGVTRIAAE